MERFVALLYSVVLAPDRRVRNAELREIAASAGLARPQTLLATGNLIFEAGAADPRGHEATLEAALEESLGRHVDVIVRAAAGWRRLIAGNPFPHGAAAAPARLLVRVMREPLVPEVAAGLERYRAPGEQVAVVDGDLWVYFAGGVAGSRLGGAITPRRAGGAGTFRNWNTVRRIGAALEA